MNLATTNNQTFVWTVSLAQWALLYDLTTARFEMQIRPTANSPTIVLAFDSSPQRITKGVATYDAASKLLTLRAPLSAAARLSPDTYAFDLAMTVSVPSAADPLKKLFTSGALVVGSGVTR